jgi:thiol-disulfide isomerase/thioredoxin
VLDIISMRRLALLAVIAAGVLAVPACRSGSTSLALGSSAPDFALPGVDGQVHKLSDYAASHVLAVVFTCNHCPASQQSERRLQQLHDDYRAKGVAVVAINPNNAEAIPASALKYSDVGDSLADMKTRATHRNLAYPYLYDGEKQNVAKAFKVTATPQVFVFDRDRKLKYEGRVDEAPAAIDALLAGRPVSTAQTEAKGCPPVWLDAPKTKEQLQTDVVEPVQVEMAGPELLKKVRANDSGKLMLVNFWATWCGPCTTEFPDLVMTHRMYRDRAFQLVTISENQSEEKDLVIAFLKRQKASARNLLFETSRDRTIYDLQAAFDKDMPAPVPFTLVLAPNGDVLYQELGSLDTLKMRRAILANLADDPAHPGVQAYWSTD